MTHLIFLPLFFLPLICNAQSRQIQIYESFIQGNMDKWASIIKEMESDKTLKSVDQKLELAGYYYGIIGYIFGKKNKDKANDYIEKGDALIDQVLNVSPGNVSANAYKGAFVSYRIVMNRYKVLALGPKSLYYLDKAYKLDSQNTLAIVSKANALFYAPKMFGGDKDEAVKFYLRSLSLMERTNKSDNNWFYFSVLVTLAHAYKYMGQFEKAKQVYEKALQKEPDFLWVKKDLLPNLKIVEKF